MKEVVYYSMVQIHESNRRLLLIQKEKSQTNMAGRKYASDPVVMDLQEVAI